jgi:hypothetical protein
LQRDAILFLGIMRLPHWRGSSLKPLAPLFASGGANASGFSNVKEGRAFAPGPEFVEAAARYSLSRAKIFNSV